MSVVNIMENSLPMNTVNSSDRFHIVVQMVFNDIFEPLGFYLDMLDHGRAYVSNEYVKIVVSHKYSAISIKLTPLCLEVNRLDYHRRQIPCVPLPSSTMVDEVYLMDALEVLAPTVTEYERYPRIIYDLELEIRRQFSLICNYLQNLLSGNNDDWERVRRYVQYARGVAISENEDYVSYLKRLENTASEAYDNLEHWKAFTFYNALRNNRRLSLKEYLRYRKARNHMIIFD